VVQHFDACEGDTLVPDPDVAADGSVPNKRAAQPVGAGARRASTEDTTDLDELPF